MADIFKIAAKKKYRFNYRGVCTVEDLWDIPLEELDKMYAKLKKEQKNLGEDSLLTKETKENKELNYKIEIIKAVVEDRLRARERAARAAEVKAQNQTILEIMADKKDADLRSKNMEELEAMLQKPDEDDDE